MEAGTASHSPHRRRFWPGLPVGERFRFIALDVETANSKPSSICQVGICCVGESGLIQTYSTYVNPDGPFEPFNTTLHGIGPQTVVKAPRWSELIDEVGPFLESQPAVFQHSSFDRRAIAAACERYGRDIPDVHWLDSVLVARRAWPELKGEGGGHGLANLKQALNIDFDHHDAGEDARASATVVLLAEQVLGEAYADIFKSLGGTPQARAKSASKKQPERWDVTTIGPTGHETVCFTGGLTVTREVAADAARQAGMNVKEKVGRSVSMLVVGNDALLPGATETGKLRRARDLSEAGHSIRILTEAEFRRILSAS